MGRRHLLTDEERAALFGVPTTRDALAKHYTLDAADLEFVLTRRTPANRLGFAAALALLRHPGLAPSAIWPPPADLIAYLAEQLGIDPRVFDDYARRPQTVGDFALEIAAALGLRPPTRADVPLMVEAAARAAWPTERGLSIVEGLVASLREARLVLPSPDTIERAGLAGRVRARKRAAETLLAGLSGEQLAKLDAFGAVDPETGRAPLTWAKDVPSAPKAEHVREILDKLREVRALGLDQAVADRVHPDRLRMLAREGRITAAYAIERYTPLRRRAILVATLLDLERRLTDAALGMADRLIGASFTRGNSARERTYTATSREVGRLMRLLHGTAAAVEAALRDGGDVAAAIDGAVGLDRLVRSAPQAAAIADLAEEDPLVRAADRWQTLRKFAPLLVQAIDFRAARAHDRTVAALEALREHYRLGRRELPKNVPMPFKKEWRKLVVGVGGKVDRRLYETALFAHVRNKLRSGDVWVERSDGYRRFDSYLLSLAEAVPITAGLGLPATADEWLAARADALDWRLRRLANRLPRGKVEGVILRDGRLSIAPVRAAKSAEADALADEIGALMPRVRVTELLHEVARETGFLCAFTNFRTGRSCENEKALLAVILADATNLGLGRMAEPATVSPATSSSGPRTPTSATKPAGPRLRAWSTRTTRSPSPRCGATAPPRHPMGNSSARASAARAPARSTHATASSPATASIHTPRTGTRHSPAPSSRRPSTRHRSSSTGCFTTGARLRSPSTTSTPVARPTPSTSCATHSVFASARACATSQTGGLPASSLSRAIPN
jgi:hypothetical protein